MKGNLRVSLRDKLKVAGFCLALALLTGCTTPMSPETIANADYGPPPPDNHQEIVSAAISGRLIDPTSGIFEFSPPSKGYTVNSQMWGTSEAFGWRVCGQVNSKNRFGGYAGRVPFFALFEGNRVSQLMIGKITSNEYGINLVNSAIFKACQ